MNELNDRFANRYSEFEATHNANCSCNNYNISLETVIDAICSMQAGKCGDEDFMLASLNFLSRLTSLFNYMMTHSFVPHQFRHGYMIPIAKDTHGNLSDVANYREITIKPMTTKDFEHVLKIVFGAHLTTSSFQFVIVYPESFLVFFLQL